MLRVRMRNPKDFWSGAIFIAVGAAAAFVARAYPMGTAMRMGPGYLPAVLGILLALLGLFVMFRSFARPGAPFGRPAFGPIALVLGPIVLFGLLLRPLGLVGAILLLVMASAWASRRFRWPTAAALAVGLAVGCAIVFVRLLGLPIPLRGTWMGG
jgi:hypothetical protein